VGKVRETAQRAVDASNLREIAKAAMVYATDNGERLPDPQSLAAAFPGSTAVFRFPAALARQGILSDPTFYFAKNDPHFSGTYPAAILNPANTQRNELDATFTSGRALAWEFVGGLKMGDPASTPIAYTRGLTATGGWDANTGVYKDTGGYVAFLGGNVAFYSSLAGKLTSNASGQAVSDIRQAFPSIRPPRPSCTARRRPPGPWSAARMASPRRADPDSGRFSASGGWNALTPTRCLTLSAI